MAEETGPDRERVGRALIISAGGTAQPLRFSIETHRPTHVVFFVSEESRVQVEKEVLPALSNDTPRFPYEFVTTDTPQTLEACTEALMGQVPAILERWGLAWSELTVDITGGTKPMSAAMALVFAEEGCLFSYVGALDAASRDRGGLGAVRSGGERILNQFPSDPWPEIAARRIAKAAAAFAAGRHFEAAREVEGAALGRRGGIYATALAGLFRAFAEWDRQHYEAAIRRYGDALAQLEAFAEGSTRRGPRELLEECRRCRPVLERTHLEWRALSRHASGQKQSYAGIDARAIPADLCAAAVRRARQGDDPEDGTLLLYAAVEKLARGRLLAVHGIDNSRCPVERLGDLAGDFAPGPATGTVELPLRQSYRLLAQLGDPAGMRFVADEPGLLKLMSARNNSWREHAYQHVSHEAFERLLPAVLAFLGLEEGSLVRFPEPKEL